MKRRSIAITVGAILFVALVIGLGELMTRFLNVSDRTLSLLYSALLTLILTTGTILLEPPRKWLEQYVKESTQQETEQMVEKCRFFIYGYPRSGKTSLIKRILTHDKPSPEISTDMFDVFEDELRLGLKNPKRISIAIADYKGQKTSQVIVDPPQKFFGPPGDRRVSIILFLVDLFPELSDDELLQLYETEAERLLQERIADNQKYISEWDIERIFSVAHSEKHLFAIRLIINKIDLLRKIQSRGYLPESITSLPEYARGLYASLEKNLRDACCANQLESAFSVHVICALDGEGVAGMVGDILEIYEKRRS